MQALMLAAGMGKRLGEYTKDVTKCMVSINGKLLIDYAIEALLLAGIDKLIIVTGYKRERLKTYLREKYILPKSTKPLSITFIDNPSFDTTNNIYSLSLATQELLKDDTILLESDIIFERSVIKELVESKDKNLAVVSHFETWMDGTVTLLNKTNDIIGIIDKKNFNWQEIEQYYKTVNIYKFSAEFSKQYYVPFLNAYQTAFGTNAYYEQVLKVVSFLDHSSLRAYPISGNRWHEIDDAADLIIAKTKFSSGEEKLHLIQQNYGGYWRFPSLLDFCYLVNPYFPPEQLVTELKSNFDSLLRHYPSGDKQQSTLAGKIFNVSPEHIAVGNGAAELIAALGKSINGIIAIPYPTFNEYPERFINAQIVPIPIQPDFSYSIDTVLSTVKTNRASAVLLINPDNPSGHFLTQNDIVTLLNKLSTMPVKVIYDESFIDFAQPEKRYTLIQDTYLTKYPNLIVIKSISKSFGVPGLRLGILASSNNEFIQNIQRQTSIWNINSFAEYFLQIYDKYKNIYENACNQVYQERIRFAQALSQIKNLTVYKSEANYLLCKIDSGISAETLATSLLKQNIFIKDLSSKKGFENGQYIRLAIRNTEENNILLSALTELIYNK